MRRVVPFRTLGNRASDCQLFYNPEVDPYRIQISSIDPSFTWWVGRSVLAQVTLERYQSVADVSRLYVTYLRTESDLSVWLTFAPDPEEGFMTLNFPVSELSEFIDATYDECGAGKEYLWLDWDEGLTALLTRGIDE